MIVTAAAPEHFRRDLARVDQIAARPGAIIDLGDGARAFDPEVVPRGELDFVSGLYTYGFANGWLVPDEGTMPRRVDADPRGAAWLGDSNEEPAMPPRKPPPLVYLDIPAVAELAGVEQSTVRKYKAQGRLPEPDIMLGQSPGWTQESVNSWLANRPGQGVGGGRPRKVVEPPPTKAKRAAKAVPAKAAAPVKRARKATR